MRAHTKRRIWTGLILGLAVVFGAASASMAAPPAPLGDDGAYHAVRSWNTTQTEPVTFLVPSTILATTAGEIYGIANYSSGSSQAISRDSDTGTRLAFWYNPDASFPTGLTLNAAENPHVLERNNTTGLWQVVAYSPLGEILNTTVLAGSEEGNFAGLALAGDGTIYTISASVSPNEIASYAPDGTPRPTAPLPDLQISFAAFNLNLAADGRLHFSAYSLAGGNTVLAGVDTDGGNLAVTPLPNAAQTTLGPDEQLFTIQYDGTIVISDTSGTTLSTIPGSAFAPSQMSPIGITAGVDGTIFVSGYAFNPIAGESTPGITALQPLRSSAISGADFTALTCDAFSTVVTATGTPPPSYYQIVSGELPPGITLNNDTGEIFGAPTSEGDFAFSIQALNGVSPTPETTTQDTADYTMRVSLKSFTTSAPIINGEPTEGSELTVSIPTWVPVPTEVSYQWLRGGEPIDGATTNAYTLGAADVGREISVTITGTADCYTAATETSATLAIPTPAPTPPPAPGTSEPSAPPHGGLAGTGADASDMLPFLASAAAALVIGAALILAARGRRRHRRSK